MHKGRLEAFSDGVIAILITIMVLELKVPHGGVEWESLKPLFPVLLSYVLSFIFIGIYWNNHHHMLHAVSKVSGAVLWANLHLLFWLSLLPFSTAWMGENHFASLPVAVYGMVLLFSGVAYAILTMTLVAANGKNSPIGKAVGHDAKGLISILIYAIAVSLAFSHSWIAYSLYVVVAMIWLIPDRRMERV